MNETKDETYAIRDDANELIIKKYVNKGCVRMHNPSIEKLFN